MDTKLSQLAKTFYQEIDVALEDAVEELATELELAEAEFQHGKYS